jgi:hypothetical protein
MKWTKARRDETSKLMRILSPDLVFCTWVMFRNMRLARDRLYFDGIFNPETGMEFTTASLSVAMTKSRFFKIYDAKRNPDLGGTLEPDAPPTPSEFTFASKYYLDNIEEESRRVQRTYKERLERA